MRARRRRPRSAILADDGEVVATFDADRLFDYRARRPPLEIVDGRLTELTWPELVAPPDTARRARPAHPRRSGTRLPLAGADGRRDRADPAARRRRVDQSRGHPGGRPAHAGRPDHRHRGDARPASRDGRGRAGRDACACRRRSCRRSRSRSRRPGIPALGYFAQVPHYVSGPYATAALELLRALGTHFGTEIAAGELTEEARELRTRLDTAASARRDDARLRRAARGDVRRAAAAVGRRPHLRHRAVPARPGPEHAGRQPPELGTRHEAKRPPPEGDGRRLCRVHRRRTAVKAGCRLRRRPASRRRVDAPPVEGLGVRRSVRDDHTIGPAPAGAHLPSVMEIGMDGCRWAGRRR